MPTIDLTPSINDTYVIDQSPNSSFGNTNFMRCGVTRSGELWVNESYVEFDLSPLYGLPINRILNAELRLFVRSDVGITSQNRTLLYQIWSYRLNQSWNENLLTWNNRRSTFFGGNWVGDFSIDRNGIGRTQSYDVFADVSDAFTRNWPTLDFELRPIVPRDVERAIWIDTKERGGSTIPVLRVEYEEIVGGEGFGDLAITVPPPSQAASGEILRIVGEVMNTGETDEIFLKVRDMNINTVLWETGQSLLSGGTFPFNTSLPDDFSRRLTMPNRTFNIRVEAGHVE